MKTILNTLIAKLLSASRTLAAISFMLLPCGIASAQVASNPNILILPFGTWQLCESRLGAALPACNGFVPGNEEFLLMMKPINAQTTKYLFTVVATMQDGSTRVFSGQASRAENGAGYTTISLYFGGVPLSFNTTVEETIATAVQTGTGTFQP